MDKARLRSRMRRRRRALAAGLPDAANRASVLLPLGSLPRFPVVAGYNRMGSEIDPAPLLDRLAATGARIVFPAVESEDGPLVFRANGEAVDPDLIIAPLLAFDRRGGRLGQGGGHYDRTIADLRRRRPLFVIGLAYAGQEIERAAFEPHDQPMDAILTEIGYSEVRKDI